MEIESQPQKDNIAIWIEKGKDKNRSNEERLAFLKKAETLARNTTNDSLKTKYFSKLSLAFLRLNDSLKFRRSNDLTQNFAKKIGDSITQAEAHWDLAEFFMANTVSDSAYYHFLAAQKIYNALDKTTFSGRMYYNMAVVQSDARDYTGSEINLIKAIELLKNEPAYPQLYSCYNSLAILSKDFEEYQQSLENHEMALNYLKKIKTRGTLELSSKNNIGTVYKSQDDFETAKRYFEEVIGYDSLYYKDTQLYAKSLNNLAHSKLKLKEESALPELFLRAMKIQDSIGAIFELSHTNYNLAEYYLAQNDTALAFTYLQTANALAKESSNYNRVLETLKLLPKVDPKNAVTYVQGYMALNDSLQKAERKIRNKFARIQFETDEVVAENELLAKQSLLWAGIALTLFLLGLSAFVIISQRVKNQKLRFQQEQQTSNQEISNLLLSQGEKLQEGKQMAQKRISEELHDGVQGRLQGARMMLLGLNPRSDEEAVRERKRAIIMLKEIQDEVRAISHELSHAAYQKIHNFIASLEDLKTTSSASAAIEIHFEYAKELDWDSLSGEIKINLYRIVQESIQNAIKHAKCNNIALKLEADAQHIKVNITDDGRGFLIKKGKKGVGMRNIASRMKKVNGTWNIDSEIGIGTTVILTIPIVRSDNRDLVLSEHENLQKT